MLLGAATTAARTFHYQARYLNARLAAERLRAHALSPDLKHGLSEAEFAQELDAFVRELETIFLVEQGQWGQLARKMKPQET